MTDLTAPYHVNQRFSRARQLLRLAEGSGTPPIQSIACLESAVLQVYFALYHYINELLVMYHRPTVVGSLWALEEKIATLNDLAEIREWHQMAQDSESFVRFLLDYPNTILIGNAASMLDVSLIDSETSSSQIINLIDEDANSDSQDTDTVSSIPLTLKTVTWLLDECYQLIQRQRAHLIEC